jgi:hypothetical protein
VCCVQNGACTGLIAPMLLPLVKRTFELLPAEGPKESEENNERIAVFSAYFTFLQHVVHAGADKALLAPGTLIHW